jgi:ABC-type sugar transport system ATPase subunit
MMPKTVVENLALVKIRELTGRFGVVNAKEERKATEQAIASVGVKSADPVRQPVNSLSGGNQQKVVIGKWVIADPKVLIVDEPTRGIDVGAKYEVYRLLLKLAANGAGILFISSEMEELIGICDRIMVMKLGQVSGSLGKDDFAQESIMALAL